MLKVKPPFGEVAEGAVRNVVAYARISLEGEVKPVLRVTTLEAARVVRAIVHVVAVWVAF